MDRLYVKPKVPGSVVTKPDGFDLKPEGEELPLDLWLRLRLAHEDVVECDPPRPAPPAKPARPSNGEG